MCKHIKKHNDFAIDFVLPYVDSSDILWQESFKQYAPKTHDSSIEIGAARYRDWGLLRYWFRGVEQFAPWVNKIHFITATASQKPAWLNVENPKLHWVKHEDFIPKDCLPVFSANPIEDCMHRIHGLSEHFVFFNDDFYLTSAVKKDFFFKKGLPCDSAVQNIAIADNADVMHCIVLNNLCQINKHFIKKNVIKSNLFKWFNLSYGKDNIKNIILCAWHKYVGFINPHFPQPFLRSSIEACWAECEEALSHTIHTRFKSVNDVTQWLFRYWQLCEGSFSPVAVYKGKHFFNLASDSIQEITQAIASSKYKTLCINDSEDCDFESTKTQLIAAFDSLLPTPSSYEIKE